LSDTKETLRNMAKFAISTNQISEVHVKNLKLWPFIFFNGVKSVKLDYDLTTNSRVTSDTDEKTGNVEYRFDDPDTKNFHISYDLEIDESQDNSNLEKRFDALEKSVYTLFWAGIPVEVAFNGKRVYQTKK